MFPSPIPDYTGGKSGAGVFQTIINHIPAHKIFVELFAGGCGVSSKMKAPECLILNDIDPGVYQAILKTVASLPQTLVLNYSYEVLFTALGALPGVFFYCDPPYLFSTRTNKRRYYAYDWGEDQHERFLSMAAGIEAPVMISHYRCDLYDLKLKEWNRVDFNAMTRGGLRVESIYFNYGIPLQLHDEAFAGLNFTDRQRIKRKAARLAKKIQAMSAAERQFILSTINAVL